MKEVAGWRAAAEEQLRPDEVLNLGGFLSTLLGTTRRGTHTRTGTPGELRNKEGCKVTLR